MAAAQRLHRLERALTSYAVQRAYDDPLVMAEYRPTGEAFIGEVVLADAARVDDSGKRPVLRPRIQVVTTDSVLVTPGTVMYSAVRPQQKARVVFVNGAAADASKTEVVLELSGGMGRSLTAAPGSVPEVGERLCYITLTAGYTPPGAFPAREDTPLDPRRPARRRYRLHADRRRRAGGVVVSSEMSGEMIVYRTDDGRTQIELRAVDGTVWLTQAEIAALFDTSVPNINIHIKAILEEGEQGQATIKDHLIVRQEGSRTVRRSVLVYNLDMILAVGYRVRSSRAVQFRQWATTVLREYLVKGFALNDERLKQPGGHDYFDELLARIRDIRASEKRFYQKVRDLFAETSVDYDGTSEMARTFFATIQKKLVYAVTGHTAAELIVTRANPQAPNMGLTNWARSRVRKTETMSYE